jgi:hypothetical protein
MPLPCVRYVPPVKAHPQSVSFESCGTISTSMASTELDQAVDVLRRMVHALETGLHVL